MISTVMLMAVPFAKTSTYFRITEITKVTSNVFGNENVRNFVKMDSKASEQNLRYKIEFYSDNLSF